MSRNKKKITVDENYQRQSIAVGSYIVKEASTRESLRRNNMLASVKRYIDAHPEDEELKDFLPIYAFVFGCTTPIVTIEQFMELPEMLVNELSEAAMSLNPHWFEVPDQEKKTDAPLTTSTNDLQTLLAETALPSLQSSN